MVFAHSSKNNGLQNTKPIGRKTPFFSKDLSNFIFSRHLETHSYRAGQEWGTETWGESVSDVYGMSRVRTESGGVGLFMMFMHGREWGAKSGGEGLFNVYESSDGGKVSNSETMFHVYGWSRKGE